ncbi:hypothetical protein SAY87_026524 [Trapa incisa]|uniref:Uncharacterized protein n=1 Tax=Trapa incisa TaxID=236973 RepID=A0AAN7GM11_9MYRT|nr:hypothetical protein SAY87_026524 [Trapa incisa]
MEMPDLPTSSAENKTQFSNYLLIPFFVLLSSLILSHPLCFFKLLSFLSPLLTTTFVVLLSTSHRTVLWKQRGNGVGNVDELDLHCPEENDDENEVYKMFFEAPEVGVELGEPQESVDKLLIYEDSGAGECLQKILEEKLDDVNTSKGDDAQVDKTWENLHIAEEIQVKEITEVETGARICHSGPITLGFASGAWRNSRRLSNSLKIPGRSGQVLMEEKAGMYVGGFGSMRQTEKEWKRTLACKLLEDRHGGSDSRISNGERDEEGMDLLWETYEKNENPTYIPQPDHDKNAVKGRKKTELQEEKEQEEDNDNDEEDMSRQQLCCLQALKTSAGKVNLGMMRRLNMAKISRALRGIGWLHHMKKTRKSLH